MRLHAVPAAAVALLGALAAGLAQAPPVPPGVVIDHEPPAGARYIGSPSIAILPGGGYLASHDFFGPGSTQSTSGVTRIFRSADRGRSWRPTAELDGQFWSNLFVHRGAVYCEFSAGLRNSRSVRVGRSA